MTWAVVDVLVPARAFAHQFANQFDDHFVVHVVVIGTDNVGVTQRALVDD